MVKVRFVEREMYLTHEYRDAVAFAAEADGALRVYEASGEIARYAAGFWGYAQFIEAEPQPSEAEVD